MSEQPSPPTEPPAIISALETLTLRVAELNTAIDTLRARVDILSAAELPDYAVEIKSVRTDLDRLMPRIESSAQEAVMANRGCAAYRKELEHIRHVLHDLQGAPDSRYSHLHAALVQQLVDLGVLTVDQARAVRAARTLATAPA